MRYWLGTVQGECVSKANSRIAVPRTSREGRRFVAFIKSEKAQDFVKAVARQTPILSPLLQGDLRFTAKLFYASRRPDLDPSALLDALQGRIFLNDRQVVQMWLTKGLDPINPRCVVKIEEVSDLFQTAAE
jgi:Holliday junction resolvase RusA-like endonuclease